LIQELIGAHFFAVELRCTMKSLRSNPRSAMRWVVAFWRTRQLVAALFEAREDLRSSIAFFQFGLVTMAVGVLMGRFRLRMPDTDASEPSSAESDR